MVQEIKLKVSMHCEKCRIEVMKSVTELSGVDEISVDLEKEILVVIGEVDPVSVAIRLRKKRRVAEILSVRKHKRKNKVLNYPRAYCNNSCQNGYEQVYGYPSFYGGGGGGNCQNGYQHVYWYPSSYGGGDGGNCQNGYEQVYWYPSFYGIGDGGNCNIL